MYTFDTHPQLELSLASMQHFRQALLVKSHEITFALHRCDGAWHDSRAIVGLAGRLPWLCHAVCSSQLSQNKQVAKEAGAQVANYQASQI